MKIFFDLPDFDAQLLRLMSLIYFDGADIGECLVAAQRIEEGNFNSWFQEWFSLAEQISAIAAECEEK
jgi:hypothetical protein